MNKKNMEKVLSQKNKKVSPKEKRSFAKNSRFNYARTELQNMGHLNQTAIDELCEDVCYWLSKGKSLMRYAKTADVPYKFVYGVLRSRLNDKQLQQLDEAREAGLSCLADEVIDIADDAEESLTGIQKAKLKVDVRKWMLEKLSPQFSNKNNENVQVRYIVAAEGNDLKNLEKIYRGVLENDNANAAIDATVVSDGEPNTATNK